MPIVASNNVPIIVLPAAGEEENQAVQRLSHKVQHLKEDYGLGVDQLAKVFKVSRPTIYTWLDGSTGHIRKTNGERIEAIYGWLEGSVPEYLRNNFGSLLRRELDANVKEFSELLSSKELDLERLEFLRPKLVHKLEGIKQSSALSSVLADKKPLI